MPGRYRLVVFEVTAIQVTPESAERSAQWCGGKLAEEIDLEDRSKKFVGINVPTLKGVQRASEGDYIYKGFDGAFDVMGRMEFEKKFEKVSV
jgi:hypothetical protein